MLNSILSAVIGGIVTVVGIFLWRRKEKKIVTVQPTLTEEEKQEIKDMTGQELADAFMEDMED